MKKTALVFTLTAMVLFFSGLKGKSGNALAAQPSDSVDATVNVAFIQIETESYSAVRENITAILAKFDARILKEMESELDSNSGLDMVIHFKNDQFHTAVNTILTNIQGITKKEIKTVHIAKELEDLKKRIKIKEQIRNKYMSLLDDAKVIIDISDTEKKLERINSEINVLNSNLINMKQKDYSTLSLKLLENSSANNPNLQTELSKSKKKFYIVFVVDGLLILVFLSTTIIWYRKYQKLRSRVKRRRNV